MVALRITLLIVGPMWDYLRDDICHRLQVTIESISNGHMCYYLPKKTTTLLSILRRGLCKRGAGTDVLGVYVINMILTPENGNAP